MHLQSDAASILYPAKEADEILGEKAARFSQQSHSPLGLMVWGLEHWRDYHPIPVRHETSQCSFPALSARE